MNYLKVFGKLYEFTNVRDVDLITIMMEILDVLEERYKGSKDLKLKADLRMVRDRIDKILEEDGKDSKQEQKVVETIDKIIEKDGKQDGKQEQKVVEIIEGDGKDGKVDKPVEIEVQHL